MDTFSPAPKRRRQSTTAAAASARQYDRRWPRIVFLLSLILLAEMTLAYLVSWVDPPQQAGFIPITISEYQARPLSALAFFAPLSMAEGPGLKHELRGGTTRQAILQTLEALAKRSSQQPLVLYISALAMQADEGEVYLLPSDSTPDEVWTWLRLRDVLLKLKACPARQKLLVLDLMPPRRSARLGNVYLNVAAAIPHELKLVADADRCVLCSYSPGQTPHVVEEDGQSIFAHYFKQGLSGQADGWDGLRDGHITIKELAAFVQHRVERWSWHNHGERQTPMLFGVIPEEPLIASPSAACDSFALPALKEYPVWLLEAWKARDAVYQSGQYRLVPRLFQQQQAMLYATESAWRAGVPEAKLRQDWLPACERLQDALQKAAKEFASPAARQPIVSPAAKKTFDAWWRNVQQQIESAKPGEAEHVKGRLCEEVRDKLTPAELDALVFAHALASPRLDPGTLRLYDFLLHPTPQTMPRTKATLRLRQLADLAMRIEVFAWPRELIETLLRCTELEEKAFGQTPSFPDFLTLLETPAQNAHAGEIRLWTHGFASPQEAQQRLVTACEQYDRLLKLNEQWHGKQKLLDEALAELPAFVGMLEKMPALRPTWLKTAAAARSLAEVLQTPALENKQTTPAWLGQVERWTAQLKTGEPHAQALRLHLQALQAPFAKEDVMRLQRQCQAPFADASSLKPIKALLSMYGPCLRAEDRAALWKAAHHLAVRLHEETAAVDRQEHEAKRPAPLVEMKARAEEEQHRKAVWRTRTQLALAELAGVKEDRLLPIRQALERCKKEPNLPAAWCELGVLLKRLHSEQMPQQYRLEKEWQPRERLSWLLAPLDHFVGIDDANSSQAMQERRLQKQQQVRWFEEYDRYLARDYHGLNFESEGIRAARRFYAQRMPILTGPADQEAHVRLKVHGTVEPLTETKPYAMGSLEVTRHVPAGKFGPVTLQSERPDDAWLDVAPSEALLPGLRLAKEPRTLIHQIPFKVTRKPLAERTGLAPPAGFLIEAHFEGRSYHHLVMTPVLPSTREVQILVSTDPKEPAPTLEEIRVRPGKTKQPFYLYVKNLTNRPRKVHVEVTAGEMTLHKSTQPLLLEPDGIHKLSFENKTAEKGIELRGPLKVQVLDRERQKVLQTRMVRVSVLAPHEYVQVANVVYVPGGAANNKWVAQVQTSQHVSGPAIAAELMLPARRIPGLLGVGGGTLHVELPTLMKTLRVLCAEKIQLANEGEQEGPVYLTIDGVQRAFIYRTTFARGGEPPQPHKDDRPAVRLNAPAHIMAGINYLVDVEVDNAPTGSKLEVVLGRLYPGDIFKAEIVREFTKARQERIGMEVGKEALVFEATIQDWTATFDTRAIVGNRQLRARLLSVAGMEIAKASQTVVIDNTPPLARLVALPAQLKRGSSVQVQAEGSDAESGIAQVFFFLGRPDKGEMPPAAPKMKAVAANLDLTLWTSTLLVPPEQQGPLTISVYVVNRAGMASVDTAAIEVVAKEQDKTGLGQIRGRVVEGPRPQPNLVVLLTDEKGKEIARTKTLPDGSFAFAPLPPGRYRLLCVKPESQRRASQAVIVDPERMSKVELSLSL